MKECPRCGIIYKNTENFCMECGQKLKALQFGTVRPEVVASLAAQVSELAANLDNVKTAITAVKAAPSGDIRNILKAITNLEKAIEKISAVIGNVEDRLGSKIAGLEQQISSMYRAQEKLELEKVRGTALSLGPRVAEAESAVKSQDVKLAELYKKLRALSKSHERLKEKPPEVNREGVKKEVTKEILKELKRMVS